MYKQGFSLNNLQRLIYHKPQPIQTEPNHYLNLNLGDIYKIMREILGRRLSSKYISVEQNQSTNLLFLFEIFV